MRRATFRRFRAVEARTGRRWRCGHVVWWVAIRISSNTSGYVSIWRQYVPCSRVPLLESKTNHSGLFSVKKVLSEGDDGPVQTSEAASPFVPEKKCEEEPSHKEAKPTEKIYNHFEKFKKAKLQKERTQRRYVSLTTYQKKKTTSNMILMERDIEQKTSFKCVLSSMNGQVVSQPYANITSDQFTLAYCWRILAYQVHSRQWKPQVVKVFSTHC